MAAKLTTLFPIGSFIENPEGDPRFELLSTLGKGSFGQVYKAKDLTDQKEIALKIVHAEHKTSNPRSETDMMYTLKNQSGVIQIFTSFDVERDRKRYLCMALELLGHTLLSQIKNRVLCETNVLKLAYDLTGALRTLGKFGILHMDIHSANVMFDSNLTVVKLVDFGMACRFRTLARSGGPPYKYVFDSVMLFHTVMACRTSKKVVVRFPFAPLKIYRELELIREKLFKDNNLFLRPYVYALMDEVLSLNPVDYHSLLTGITDCKASFTHQAPYSLTTDTPPMLM